jgi:haloacetate dehalogenase
VFERFALQMIDADGVAIRTRHRLSSGKPPLLLLHGNPQTHCMWHKVAARLAERYSVVASDLTGYGDSAKPQTTKDHAPYSKRAMANTQVALMRKLGFERFCVAGHDRGGRVAYRMAFDHPERIERLAVLDIVPTWEAYKRADMAFGMSYFHWFFMTQPFDLPERLIGADPELAPAHLARAEGRGFLRHRSARRLPPLLQESSDDPRHLRGLSRGRHHRHGDRRGRPHGRPQDRSAAARAVGG